MKKIKICLLVTDDPDDQLEFTEALDQVTNDILVLTIAASEKALYVVEENIIVPDYLFLNLTIEDLDSSAWATYLARHSSVVTVTFGDVDFFQTLNKKTVHFLNHDFNFSQLRNFLTQLINP
jgi:hypothetical protein